jgi:hypothetical protein
MNTTVTRACLVAAALAAIAAAAPAHAQSVRLSTRWFKSDVDQDGCNAVATRVLQHSGLKIEKTGGAATVGTDDNHTVIVTCDAPALVILSVAWRQRPGVEAETAEVQDLIARLKRRMN